MLPNPLIELHDDAITHIGTQAIVDFYHTLAVEKLQLPGLLAVVTKTDSPFLNVVLDTRADKENSQKAIELIDKFFIAHQVPWNWFITPLTSDNDLLENGFSWIEDVPGLYFDLTLDLPEMSSSSISIIEATAEDNLIDWIRPMQEGFPSEAQCSPENDTYRQLNAGLLHKGEKKLRHFIAYYQGELAGAATLFLSKDSVMLHNLAVLKKFQRKGVGRVLGLHRMAIAKQLGFKHCFLDASEEGFKLHKALGFRVYCVTKIYNRDKKSIYIDHCCI